MSLATDFIVVRQPQAPMSCIAFGLYRSPPAIGGEVGLHKDFNSDKAPDTPPGRIDDVAGGFQIVPTLVGDQRIAEPSGLDCVQAVLLAQHPVDLIQLFRAGAGIRLPVNVGTHKSSTPLPWERGAAFYDEGERR